jgi:hypothetical protein
VTFASHKINFGICFKHEAKRSSQILKGAIKINEMLILKDFASLKAYPKIISEVPEKSGVEAFARTFPAPIRNFGICT